MKRIRTKLVLSLLVSTLLPIYPVYYQVKSLLQQSIEVGYNENVVMALDQAAAISRELYSIYKGQTLSQAKELSSSGWARKLFEQKNSSAIEMEEKAKWVGGKIDVFDMKGNLVLTGSSAQGHAYPMIYQNTIVQLTKKRSPEILDLADDPGHILAFAPIKSNGENKGFLVVTKIIDEEFAIGSRQVVRVNQMFKTLDFFEGEVTSGFLLFFFVVYIPVAGLSIGLGIYFSRKITSPLLSLVKGTKKIAGGDWDYRVKADSKDEVGDLVDAFNTMITTLKEKQDQVVSLEKMAAWREIARILAHEIKNPLTPIQLTVQQMKDKYEGDDPEYSRLLEECSEIVTDEIESLRTLVREFSEFARMPKLSLAPGDFNELIEEVRKLYPNNNISLELESALPELNFDHEKMRRVIINLIENGLDSISEKGEGNIRIRTNLKDKMAVMYCADTGNGIPDETREKIFEPYFSTKKSGMGLGLAIVKRIIEEHGGRISVESKEGEGTKFEIELPVKNESH
ncbi:HAMP domain-containing protein [candidate division KSB1 bacterium]|nr:HAMP domain-containing protein [candidate division KSB1 bacterium]